MYAYTRTRFTGIQKSTIKQEIIYHVKAQSDTFRVSKLCYIPRWSTSILRMDLANPSGISVVQTTSTVVQQAMNDPKRDPWPKNKLVAQEKRKE